MTDPVKNRPVVGKPLWHTGDGETAVLGFLIAEVNSNSINKLVIGFIEEGVVSVVPPEECWAAEIHEVKCDLRGIICTNPNWGAGVISERFFDSRGQTKIRVTLPNGGSVTTSLSEVAFCCFGSR